MSATGMMKGQWKSAYSGEITNALQKCKIESDLVHDKSALKKIKQSIEMYEMGKVSDVITEQRKHSLRYFPAYPHGMGRQPYLTNSEASSTLTQFRFGNAELGNRDSPPVTICPACKNGQNTESHLVFECKEMDHLKAMMPEVMAEFEARNSNEQLTSNDERLKKFLGGDFATTKTLEERGKYLSILKQKLVESK